MKKVKQVETRLRTVKTYVAEETEEYIKLDHSDKVVEFMRFFIRPEELPVEKIWVFALNSKLEINNFSEVSKGARTGAMVDISEIFRLLMLSNANSFILVHNHPSGNPKPSAEDRNLTKELTEAGELMRIKLTDHIIMGENTYFSFQKGTINEILSKKRKECL